MYDAMTSLNLLDMCKRMMMLINVFFLYDPRKKRLINSTKFEKKIYLIKELNFKDRKEFLSFCDQNDILKNQNNKCKNIITILEIEDENKKLQL